MDAEDSAAWAAVVVAVLAFVLSIFNFVKDCIAQRKAETNRLEQQSLESADRRAQLLKERNALLDEASSCMSGAPAEAISLYGVRNNLVQHFCQVDYSILDDMDKFGIVPAVKAAHARIPLCNSGEPEPAGISLVELQRACIAAHTLYPHVRAAKSRSVQLPWQLPASVPAWKVLTTASTALELWSKILAIQQNLPQGTWTDAERSRANAFVSMCLPFKAVHWRLILGEGHIKAKDWEIFKAAAAKSLPLAEDTGAASVTGKIIAIQSIMQDLLGITLP